MGRASSTSKWSQTRPVRRCGPSTLAVTWQWARLKHVGPPFPLAPSPILHRPDSLPFPFPSRFPRHCRRRPRLLRRPTKGGRHSAPARGKEKESRRLDPPHAAAGGADPRWRIGTLGCGRRRTQFAAIHHIDSLVRVGEESERLDFCARVV